MQGHWGVELHRLYMGCEEVCSPTHCCQPTCCCQHPPHTGHWSMAKVWCGWLVVLGGVELQRHSVGYGAATSLGSCLRAAGLFGQSQLGAAARAPATHTHSSTHTLQHTLQHAADPVNHSASSRTPLNSPPVTPCLQRLAAPLRHASPYNSTTSAQHYAILYSSSTSITQHTHCCSIAISLCRSTCCSSPRACRYPHHHAPRAQLMSRAMC